MEFKRAIKKYAKKHELPAQLINAIIQVESSGNQFAIRYEKDYRWLFNPENYVKGTITLDTEKTAQKTSWGLMQLMGATARELGFDKTFLSELLDVDTNLNYSCKFLKQLKDRYGDMEKAIAAYNAGSPRKCEETNDWVNQGYVDKVLKAWS